jgi:hypothetical protein
VWPIADRRSCLDEIRNNERGSLIYIAGKHTHIVFVRHQRLDALYQAKTRRKVQALPAGDKK